MASIPPYVLTDTCPSVNIMKLLREAAQKPWLTTPMSSSSVLAHHPMSQELKS